jgi:hypothetical protein
MYVWAMLKVCDAIRRKSRQRCHLRGCQCAALVAGLSIGASRKWRWKPPLPGDGDLRAKIDL